MIPSAFKYIVKQINVKLGIKFTEVGGPTIVGCDVTKIFYILLKVKKASPIVKFSKILYC